MFIPFISATHYLSISRIKIFIIEYWNYKFAFVYCIETQKPSRKKLKVPRDLYYIG